MQSTINHISIHLQYQKYKTIKTNRKCREEKVQKVTTLNHLRWEKQTFPLEFQTEKRKANVETQRKGEMALVKI